jgi:L-asparaginase II
MTRFELLARSRRGGFTECWHFGAVTVSDPTGGVVAWLGDPSLPVFLRSAAKPFQAAAMLRSGLDRLSLEDAELALVCASHAGEAVHVRGVLELLARRDLEASALLCGPHEPLGAEAARRLRSAGEPASPLHNNGSGKHAGMLLTCSLAGWSAADYGAPEHPLQAEAREAIGVYCGVAPGDLEPAIDGCSVPTYRVPLHAVARGYALLAEPGALPAPGESVRAERIFRSMTGAPCMVAGEDRFTTQLMEAGGGAILGKEGADGLYAAALRTPRPLGVAIKIADGSEACREAVVVEVLRQLGALDDAQLAALAGSRVIERRNFRGLAVGDIVAELKLVRADAA